MHDVAWDRLDAAGFRVSMKRSVRRFGTLLAIAGAAVAACGVAAAHMPLTALGGLLAGVGLWNVMRPSVTGLLVDGVTLLVNGGLLCLTPLWVASARTTSLGKWIFAGLLQVAWGYRRLALHSTARHAPNDPPAIARLEAIVREVARRPAVDPTLVEFRTGRWGGRRKRLGLFAEGVVALLDEAVRLETRTDVWIETSGTTALGSAQRVVVRLSDLELAGRMSTEHFERFERWKLGMAPAPSVAA